MNNRFRRRYRCVLLVCLWLATGITVAEAQQTTRPVARRTPPPSRGVEIGGYAMVGRIDFSATESFDAILDTHAGPVVGGGARLGLPWFGLFAEIGAWRFRADGERAFVHNGTRFPLGIDTTITVTPIEVSGGWRWRMRRVPRLTPYVAGGITSLRYEETSDFADANENVDENFAGYLVYGGAAYKITRWLGIAGEAAWSTVPDAIGDAGVSAAFKETNLGGTALRLKITIGR